MDGLVNYRKNISTKSLLFSEGWKNEMLIIHKVISFLRLYFLDYLGNRAYYFMAIFRLTKVVQLWIKKELEKIWKLFSY